MQEINDTVVVFGVEGEQIATEVVADDKKLATVRFEPGEHRLLVTPFRRPVDHILTLAHRAPSDFAQVREVVLRNAGECLANALYSVSIKRLSSPVSLIFRIFASREERALLFVHRALLRSPPLSISRAQ